ncbi:MAG: alkaline phosphatase family protein [Armatimonadota bacterium]|jgi:predicted AlkP superfamily phosphohydrolase/phosphomutase
MLLLIGVDGATPELIERLTSTGQMPALRSLMRHGVYGRLQSSANYDPCSAWASLLTGVNPGKHGVWGLRNLVPESYQWRAANSRMLRAPSLPQMLTDRGQEAGTLFVPMTYPAKEAEYTTVSGWLAPSIDDEHFAHPASVASLARRRLKGLPHSIHLGSYAAAGRYDQGVDLAAEAMSAKASVALDLLDDRRWDFLGVNFTELDRVLRWYWHLIDRNHADFRDDLYSDWGETIIAIHQAVDAQIARLVAALEPDDHLMIASTYGMGVNSRAALCLPEMLAHLDLVVPRSSAGGAWRGMTGGIARIFGGLGDLLRDVLPQVLAELIPASRASGEPSRAEGRPWFDHERSWVVPTPDGHIYLNHEDTFPNAPVGNGDADRLMLQVTSSLRNAIDPATGRRPLEWARSRKQVFSGPFVSQFPDIVTRWDQSRTVMGLTATGRNGRVQVARPPTGRTPSGAPSPEGVLIAAGGGFQRGARIEGAAVEDVAATIMHLRGERVPSYFDGAVLKEALTDRMLEQVPVRILQRDLPRMIEDPDRIQAASEAVASRLRALRYEL